MNYRKPSGARPSSVFEELLVFVDDVSSKSMDESATLTPSSHMLHIDGDCVDQSDVPCCVAIALTTAMRFVGQTPPLSALFNYYFARTDPASLDDVEPFNAFRSAKSDGVCTTLLHADSFVSASANIAPSEAAKADALDRRLRPTSTGQPRAGRIAVDESVWRSRIVHSLPVVVAFFMSPEYDAIRSGTTVEHAQPTTVSEFGHACVAIGYDDVKRHFVLRDSRGPNIGVAGTWHLPYERLADGFIFESWVITEVP